MTHRYYVYVNARGQCRSAKATACRLLEKSIGTILRHAIFKTSRRLRRARPSNEINESNDSYVESIHVSADAGE